MDYERIGKNIRVLRKRKQYTQASLAEKTGISTSFLGHVERGSRVASLETLASLAEALGVSLDVLVHGQNGEFAMNDTVSAKSRLLNDIQRVLLTHMEEWLKDPDEPDGDQ